MQERRHSADPGDGSLHGAGDRRERSTPGGNAGEAAYHLLLLAQNAEGYKNLLKLGSIAYREGFYYKPRIDKEVLREYSKGLIATSSCLGGEIPTAILKHDMKAARRIAETYQEIFGPERFYIEVQKQGIREQDEANPELAELAKKLGIGIVATNDVHFLHKEDHFAHDVLCCISMGRLITDENRLKYPTELYLKTAEEMAAALGNYPEAIENTVRIARMCDLTLDFSKRYAPVYKVPQENLKGADSTNLADDERYLRQLCEDGLTWRYGKTEVAPEIRTRLEHELKIIAMKHFCSYFLIVWDFCNYARSQGHSRAAPGAAASARWWAICLGLCNVDPLRYELLFERFMDPNRDEMPDIDIDICQDGRAEGHRVRPPEVRPRRPDHHLRHARGQGGRARTSAACWACRCRRSTSITKLIPGAPGMTLDKALEQEPDLAALYDDEPARSSRSSTSRKRLEGLCPQRRLPRGRRDHRRRAAGQRSSRSTRTRDGNILTQFEGPIAEKVRPAEDGLPGPAHAHRR